MATGSRCLRRDSGGTFLWIRRYIVFHGKRHPLEMGSAEVAAFLSHLAERASVSASTQNQALCALLFLYRQVLDRPLGPLAGVAWAKKGTNVTWLIAVLLYGAGLRLTECFR